MPKQFNFDKLKRPNDVYLRQEEFGEGDVAILVMGSTGSGKSTFINNVLTAFGSSLARATISDGYESCSSDLCHYVLPLPKDRGYQGYKRAVLLDTPGFDNSHQSDEEILRRIAVWITSCNVAGVRIGGLVYVHSIFPARMGMSHGLRLDIFRQICGTKALSMAVFATSRWDLCSPEGGLAREQELKKTFWSDILQSGRDEGAQLERLDNTPQSAKRVLHAVFQALPRQASEVRLALQQQLVEKSKSLEKTDAGRLVGTQQPAFKRFLAKLLDLLRFNL